ncbi:MAG: O-phosphoserine--tRNA ligase [Candidatus Altiarchaeales archaeon]|nr:O-phosphoserine--tRNA ligase [Candidatus Altiarchaeales archaeon]
MTMDFNPKEIKRRAKADFHSTWVETAKQIPQKSGANYLGEGGKPHPIHELTQQVRQIFLGLGFDEVENPYFISEEDVYKQYGPEAPVILDRCYYLAGLPRPDIGLSEEKKDQIRGIHEGFDFKGFQKILRRYRQGEVEGDDFVESMVVELNLGEDTASKILSLFPEFRQIKPVASKQTLRSHMTGAWFLTLKSLLGQRGLPVKLFSVGVRFRREQRIDASHLRAHYGGSMVIADGNLGFEGGLEITQEILNRLGFTELRFEKKKGTSNYYAPGLEYEIYSGEVEIADCGMYSPIALANYDIDVNVFNLGFGLERILMQQTGREDVREILYPQFYSSLRLSDEEIAENISIDESPETQQGKNLKEALVKAFKDNAKQKSPCRIPAWKGELAGVEVAVDVVEREENSKLLGPAAENEVYVFKGEVYGLPKDAGKLKYDISKIKEGGVKLSFGFLDAVCAYFAKKTEEQIKEGGRQGYLQVKMAKSPQDVNIHVQSKARRYIESQNKRISLKGPVFAAIQYRGN